MKSTIQKYIPPALDLLQKGQEKKPAEAELQVQADRITAFFGMRSLALEFCGGICGPRLVSYHFKTGSDTKVFDVIKQQDDLARFIGVKHLEIENKPEQKVVSVITPAPIIRTVSLRSCLKERSSDFLQVTLGQTPTGDLFHIKLDEQPHLLIAGATGSGKSNCLHTIILSLLFQARPDDLRLILIDVEGLTLFVYEKLQSHHVLNVISNPGVVQRVLRTIRTERDRRGELLKKAQVSNIGSYNQTNEKLPYIFLIVDELAMLLSIVKGIENDLISLGSLARKTGIHLILATQRPCREIVTGRIKANFPGRIALQTASVHDSKVIIGTGGAEHLIGKGDALYYLSGNKIRFHCAFVSRPEIETVVQHFQSQPAFGNTFQTVGHLAQGSAFADNSDPAGEVDVLEQARQLFKSRGRASIQSLQKHLHMGHIRASRVYEQLQAKGF